MLCDAYMVGCSVVHYSLNRFLFSAKKQIIWKIKPDIHKVEAPIPL